MNPAQVVDQMIADPSINGQHVDVDHAFGGQCWDLVELFAERCGVPKEPWAITLGPTGSAKEAWLTYDTHMQKYFDKIPAGQQQKGDITVYDGHGIYTAGHIAISLGGSAVFEENADPDESAAHVYQTRSSTYLLGALRLKGVTPQKEDMVDKGTVSEIFNGCLLRPPVQEEYDRYVGKIGAGALASQLNNSPERAQLLSKLILDEEGVRILAVGILERPEPLTTTPDLVTHIGGGANEKIKEFWYSPEGKKANAWRQAQLKKSQP